MGLGKTTRQNEITHRLTVGLAGNLAEVDVAGSLFVSVSEGRLSEMGAGIMSVPSATCLTSPFKGEDLASCCFDVCYFEFPQPWPSLSDCEKSN